MHIIFLSGIHLLIVASFREVEKWRKLVSKRFKLLHCFYSFHTFTNTHLCTFPTVFFLLIVLLNDDDWSWKCTNGRLLPSNQSAQAVRHSSCSCLRLWMKSWLESQEQVSDQWHFSCLRLWMKSWSERQEQVSDQWHFCGTPQEAQSWHHNCAPPFHRSLGDRPFELE